MLDRDLTEMSQTETKFINRAMKRNPERFPQEFVFQLSADEKKSLRYHLALQADMVEEEPYLMYSPSKV